MAKLVALAAALLLCPPSALAWGGLGHEAICELAFLELDDTARQRVIALIRLDPEFPTFRASCNWPDRPRQRASEHFVNLPRDSTGLDDHECPMAEECVVRSRPLSFSSWNAIWQMILWPMSLQASAGVWPENTTGQASQPSKRPFQDLLSTNA